MWRKNDRQPQDMESIVQRLRDERPEASGLELDRVKTTAMRAARSTGSGARFRSRRLAVIGLTLGLSAAGTGGVLAAGGATPSAGNAAKAQYSTITTVTTVTVPVTITTTISGTSTTITSLTTSTLTESVSSTVTGYATSTLTSTAAVTASGEVLGAKEEKAASSDRKLKVHFTRFPKSKLKELKVTVEGKTIKVVHGNKRYAEVSFAGVICSSKRTPVVVTAVFTDGKTASQTGVYWACVS
jgi:hypothetical protein